VKEPLVLKGKKADDPKWSLTVRWIICAIEAEDLGINVGKCRPNCCK